MPRYAHEAPPLGTGRLPLVLWPLGIAAELCGARLPVPRRRRRHGRRRRQPLGRRVVHRLRADRLAARPDSRTGPLMTLTGFLYLSEALLSEVDSDVAYTLGQWSGNWWTPAVRRAHPRLPERAAHLPGRPGDRRRLRLRHRGAPARVAVLLPVPGGPGERVPDLGRPGTRRTRSTASRAGSTRRGPGAGDRRHLALAPRRAAAAAAAAADARRRRSRRWSSIIQIYYALLTGEFIRSSQEVTSVLLVSVPLAFLFGILHQQLARAGMADLVVALHRAPGVARGSARRSRRRSATRRSCSRTGCRASTPTSTPTASPVALPEDGLRTRGHVRRA